MSLRDALAKLPPKQQEYIITRLAESIVRHYQENKNLIQQQQKATLLEKDNTAHVQQLRTEIESLY